MEERAEIVIAGAGAAGLALATALSQALGARFSVVVCDAALAREPANNDRVSAITAGGRRLFEILGIWRELAASAQPVQDMVITDSRLEDAVRPAFLSFAGEAEPGEPIAHLLENRDLLMALRTAAAGAGARLISSAVEGFELAGETIAARLSHETTFQVRLLVAADGARSKLRAAAGIKTVSWSYGQSGIVATVGHEREHEGRAVENFLPSGPFAILPLTGRRSSIVWTEPTKEALRLIGLPAGQFHGELERRFGLKLGEIEVLSPPRAYPLNFSIARQFVHERLALIGDAAHVVHPIAGQGLNLGLRDVAALAECITEIVRLGLDPGSPEVLDRYERWRRFDTLHMAFATDSLNRLFSNRSDALKLIRDLGMGLVERMPPLKQFFVREAAGLTGEIPKLLRGEAL